MPHRYHRKDNNQDEIVNALRRVGATVESISATNKGIPDLLVGYKASNYLLEVKNEKGKVTPEQTEFAASWRGQSTIVRSISDALRAIGL